MGMTAPCVMVERDGPVAIVRLDRPPVNALELGIAAEAKVALDGVLGSGFRGVVGNACHGCRA